MPSYVGWRLSRIIPRILRLERRFVTTLFHYFFISHCPCGSVSYYTTYPSSWTSVYILHIFQHIHGPLLVFLWIDHMGRCWANRCLSSFLKDGDLETILHSSFKQLTPFNFFNDLNLKPPSHFSCPHLHFCD